MFGMIIAYSVNDEFIVKACSQDNTVDPDGEDFEKCVDFVNSWFLLLWAGVLVAIATWELMWVSVFKAYRDELTEFGAEGY